MTLSELASIYDEKIDFLLYWKRVIPESLYIKSFPCKCILHDEQNGASFSYSYKSKIWSCFGKCSTTGKVVNFHQRYLKKKDDTVTLYKTLLSLLHLFPDLQLPNPTIIQPNQHSTLNNSHNISELDNVLFKSKMDTLASSINSDDVNIELLDEQDVSDINKQILNLFIERRFKGES